MATADPHPARACAYTEGVDGLKRWSATSADAWIGLLEVHKRLTRELDAELEARYGLGLSALELLARLGAADDHRLRLSKLAAHASLSLSRVSRIVDQLEARGLVRRTACPSDGRAINAELTDTGLALLRQAQATHFEGVQRRFFDRLDEAEVATLAAVFTRFGDDTTSCRSGIA